MFSQENDVGNSYVEYKEHGFWSRDRYISEWIDLIVAEMEPMKSEERWLQPVIAHWRIQVEVDGGCMSLRLNEFVSDDTKREMTISLAEKALTTSTELTRRTGELFIELLRGKLRTTASSPIDYF